jgi:hypothetical protein
MNFAANAPQPQVPTFPVRPRMHRDLIEAMLLDAANDNLPGHLITLDAGTIRRCSDAADWLGQLLSGP